MKVANGAHRGLARARPALYEMGSQDLGRFLGTFGVQLIEGSGKVALVAAALLALTLAGCGRKSSLDPPPTAAVQQPGQQGEPQATRQSTGFGLFDPNEEEQLAAPPGQKRRLIIDRILD